MSTSDRRDPIDTCLVARWNCGSAFSGVVGNRRFTFDIWEDAVNKASFMEAHGVPGRINVSETVAGHVKNLFELESRGSIESKHERTHQMLFLNRLKPESSGNRDGSAPNENFAAEYNRLTGFRMTPPVVPSFRGTTKSRARNS